MNPDLLLFEHVIEADAFDLLTASLVAVAFEYPDLDVARYAGQVDGFARTAEEYLEVSEPGAVARGEDVRLAALDRALFGALGFSGNQDDYYDPRNMYLNEVIDRKTGIPITLSVLYMETGRRLGLELDGLSFPGHFLVRHRGDDQTVFIDPFHKGARLDIASLEARLRRVVGPGAELADEYLEPASHREILMRMLSNLAAIHRRAGDIYRGIAVLERMLVVDPGNERAEGELRALERRCQGLN